MKAPEKIYIKPYTSPNMFGGLWSGKPTEVATVPYIRKDLLLEWAKELTSEPYDRTTESARKHQTAHYLLEKYNSL